MKLIIDLKFKESKSNISCKAKIDGKTFFATKRIQHEADRVNAVKRARQMAYLAVMVKIHGYTCEHVIMKDE